MPEMVTCPMCQRSAPADTVHTCPGVPVHVGHWTVTASDTKETFPRGPSNEQTLITELGEVKRALEKSAWDERELEGSLAMARQHIALLQKERDALAVAAEGLKKAYRLQRKGMESMAELQDGLKQEVRNQAEQIKQLKCKADLFDNFTAAVVALEPHAGKPEASVEALLDKIGELKIVEAERDALKAKLAEVQEDLEDEQDSGDSAYAADTKRIYEIRELTAERDALAVTAEGLREELAKWKPLTPEEAQKAFDEAKAEPLSDERIAEILRHATDPAYTMPNSEQAQLAVTAERQAEQIKRLRESLEWAVDVIEGNLDRKKYFGPERVNAARAILKETAP